MRPSTPLGRNKVTSHGHGLGHFTAGIVPQIQNQFAYSILFRCLQDSHQEFCGIGIEAVNSYVTYSAPVFIADGI